MTATIDGGGLALDTKELADKYRAEPAEEPIIGDARSAAHRAHAPFPWIGALPNPRLGPMVVVNDGGYLVPLCTVGDQLRGCRYLWRRTQDYANASLGDDSNLSPLGELNIRQPAKVGIQVTDSVRHTVGKRYPGYGDGPRFSPG